MASAERREFDKYLKFLTAKVCQVVVQSRQGTPILTRSSAQGNDWFNLCIGDVRSVGAELKRVLEGRLPHKDSPLCVEILLSTAEGDSVILEVWSVNYDPSKRDVAVSVPLSLYPRLSLMLKSLVTLTRVTPAHTLSRQAGELKFTFRVYLGRPELGSQAAAFTHVQFAECVCPYGSISMAVDYLQSITLPTRVDQPSPSLERLSELARENSDNGSLSGRLPFQPPFAVTTAGSGEDVDLVRQPFAAILPRPSCVEAAEAGCGASERGGGGEETQRCASSPPPPCPSTEPEGYIMVDLREIRPAFAAPSHRDELSQLLQSCKEAPPLELFAGEGSMDVVAAMDLVSQHTGGSDQ